MPMPPRKSAGIGLVSALLTSWLTTIRPFATRTLCECVPGGMAILASSLQFLGSRTSTTEVPCGLRMWPM